MKTLLVSAGCLLYEKKADVALFINEITRNDCRRSQEILYDFIPSESGTRKRA